MKRVIFSTLLVAGLLISHNGFSDPNYGHRGSFEFHARYGNVSPRPYFIPVPRPVIYAAPIPYYAGYHNVYYGHPFFHRHFCRR
jgi:hypothetical protein